MSRVFWKLTWSGARQRVTPALLTVMLAFAGSFILSLALQLRGIADDPWDSTFERTRGPHVEVMGDAAALARARAAAGEAEFAGPFPSIMAETTAEGSSAPLRIEGRAVGPSRIDQPMVTDGAWLQGGGIVLERSFANEIGVRPGDTLLIRGRQSEMAVTVSGLAVTVTQERYPLSVPGLAWAEPSTLAQLNGPVPGGGRLLIRLSDPALASVTADSIRAAAGPGSAVSTWTELRAKAMDRVAVSVVILRTFGVLMLMATASIVPLGIAAGAATRAREFSRLKALGCTRRSLALMVTAESLLFASLAAIAGGVAGLAFAPKLIHYQVELGGVPAAQAELPPILTSAALTTLAIGLAAWVAAWRVAGVSPVQADLERQASRVCLPLIPVIEATRLPLSVVLGTVSLWRRPRRAVLTVACLTLGFAAVASALTMEATFDAAETRSESFAAPAGGLPAINGPLPDDSSDEAQFRPLVYQLTAAMVLLGVVALGMTTLLGVVERAREFGIIRAIGASARQIAVNVVSGSWAVALLAVLFGLPGGVVMFYGAYAMAGGRAEEVALPSLVLVVAAAMGLLALSAAAAALPARRAWAETATSVLRNE